MNKVMVTAIIDEDIFDELCAYPDHRVKFMSEAANVRQDGYSLMKTVKCQKCGKEFEIDITSLIHQNHGDNTFIQDDFGRHIKAVWCRDCAVEYYHNNKPRRVFSCYPLDELAKKKGDK